ncbi:MAG: isoleucine--tRNA ligase [Thermoleophilia bacterium]|nr:isoleucine--tRNA ligase [Thermoleophilia bacterium]
MFERLPSVPDHAALEQDVLELWEERRVFERLRERNADGPVWSFIDGPITANKRMGVHHMWGRTLKDVFQRYKALRGYHQRYQNGFDCQGLWVEVGVERELGLNSKREIEEFGLAEFSRRCRDKVAWSAGAITEQSKRLGMWMDWGNDYFTFSDTNIEYIWRFLAIVHERGWLYRGHRSTEWCPRCGTSISQHELAGYYFDKVDPSLFVRFPLVGREGEALVVWTTTPWTLPANVAAAVLPDADYALLPGGDWVAAARHPDAEPVRVVKGSELVGLAYTGPFHELPAAGGVEHRVIAWDEVSLEEGSGIVHIAPGCGGEDFELSKTHELPVLAPVDEAGRFYPSYGWLAGLSTVEAADRIVDDLRERGLLAGAGEIEHRYPFCWRCETPLIFRLTDDWFIAADPVRPQLLEANAAVEWTPDYFGKRMDDWLRNMDDWNISRQRYFGLPLPFYPCACGHLNVIGSLAELNERATAGLEGLEELHRPWIDEVTIRCESCGGDVHRIPEVGDVWLDAGIVPFATLGWRNPSAVAGGYATGASRGLSGADLPDHSYWERWFPAHWVSEMREQIRLWFYSLLFMSVVLEGRAPYRQVLSYEKLLDEDGRAMHGSLGNAIDADEAFARMGADVMRWMYCAQPPSQNIRFGFGPAELVKRKLLTTWNSVSFLVTYGGIEGFRPRYDDLAGTIASAELRPLDRWLLARTQELLADATRAYESFMTVGVIRAFEAFVDDLSNWYIRRSRRRFYEYDDAAFRTLWYALVQAVRVIGPVMPFLAEHLWQRLVAGPCDDAPDSVFLAGWPEPLAELADEALVAEVADARQAIELGRAARQAAGVKLRQPLRRVVVCAPDPERQEAIARQVEEVAGELNVKEVELAPDPSGVATLRATSRLDLVGPRIGAGLPDLRRRLAEGDFDVDGGRLRAGPHELVAGEYALEYVARDGYAVAQDADLVVAVDTRIDGALELEGRALDVIHQVQRLRREAGLEITDRILLAHDDEAVFAAHGERIARETLAVGIERRAGESLSVVRVS